MTATAATGEPDADPRARATMRQVGGHVVVVPPAEIDLVTSPELSTYLHALINEGHRTVVVDLAGVDVMDSTGLSVLVSVFKRLRDAGGAVAVARPRPHLRKIFALTALDRVFSLYPSVQEALDALPPD